MKNLFLTLALMLMVGMPQLHGVNGCTFGSLVSGLATSNPSALVSHVSGR